MENHLIPLAERRLTPEEVDILDARRRRGQLCLVMGLQFLMVSALMLLWSGQDATYSPGWAHPMLDWDIITFVASMVCFFRGVRLRRGMNEFFSY